MKDAGQAMKSINNGMDIDKVEEAMYAIPVPGYLPKLLPCCG